jgi:hypothetical protein
MTIGKTQTTGPGQTRPASNGGIATARRGIRGAVLRYLRWRAVSQLRRLDARTLQASGIHAEDILAAISRAQSASGSPRRGKISRQTFAPADRTNQDWAQRDSR